MEKKKKSKAGAPSKYVKLKMGDKLDEVGKLCMLGLTMEQLADYYEVHKDTIYEWQKVYPEFSDAIKSNTVLADVEVAKSTFKKATGFEYEEEESVIIKGVLKTIKVKKYAKPDTMAAMFWLQNRQPENWKNKKHHQVGTEKEQIFKIGDIEVKFG